MSRDSNEGGCVAQRGVVLRCGESASTVLAPAWNQEDGGEGINVSMVWSMNASRSA